MLRAIVRLGLLLLLATAAGASARADPAELVQAGAEALQQGKWDDAIRVLDQAIATRALSGIALAVAYNHRGYAYFGKGQADRAIADYTEAIRIAPKDADAYNLRGWAHFTKGSMNRAIADSTAAIRIDPKLAFAHRNRGRAQLYSGRPKAAADDFAQAVRLVPSDALGVIWLHVANVRSGRKDLAEYRANAARVDRQEWPGMLLDVVTGASTPEQIGDIAMSAKGEKTQAERVCDARVYFGLLQLAAGDKAAARPLLKLAAGECPVGVAEATELSVANLELKSLGDVPARREPLARAPSGADVAATHQERADAYFEQGQVERAIAEYGSAIRSASGDAQSYRMRGLAHFTRGSMNQAIADASAAIRLDPNSFVSFRVRGLAHLYADDPRSAAEDFADAVRLAPSDAVGVIMLHVARVRAGHEDIQEFRANVAKVDRGKWPGPLVEVLTGESTVERVGDIAKSSDVEKTRRERLCDARVYFGLLQLAAGDKGEARKLFGAAVEDCPPGTAEAAERAVAKMELRQLGAASPRARPSRTPTPQMSEDSARRSR